MCFVLFVLFVRVKSSCKKNKNKKKVQNCPDTLIYYTSDVSLLNLSIKNLFIRTYFYLWASGESLLFMRIFWISSCLWSSVRIFSFYENLFKSLLIYNHLWESLLFMRIFLNFFLYMINCENLFESFLIYDHLWESFPFMRILFNPFFFITNFFNYQNLFQLSQSFLIPSFLSQPC